MSARRATASRLRAAAGGLLVAGLLAGCGSSVGLGLGANGSVSSADSGSSGYGAASGSTSKSSGMGMGAGTSGSSASMSMSGTSSSATAVPEVNGIKPVAYKALATAYWQGMKIEAMSTTPTTFMIYDGTNANGTGQYSEVKANRRESFHLMGMLTDQHTHVEIPYATVWATIYNAKGKMVFNESQWPMISAYMGSHYGNNVTLPGPGRYTLKLLITPPQVARPLEYANVWKGKHDVTASFTWKPVT
jgi:hypothetical protein